MATGPFRCLAAMANSNGLSILHCNDGRGESWMEIRPPTAATIQVPFYGYRTHFMRLIVNCQLNYWMEALGQCVRSGSFHLLANGRLDVSEIKVVFELLGGGATLCKGRDSKTHSSFASDETSLDLKKI